MINNKELKKDIEKQIYRVFSKYFDEPYFSSNRYIEEMCCWFWKWVYKIKALPTTLKLFYQRITKGFDDLDKWNAAWYIAKKAVPVLRAWRNGKMHSTPIRWHREDRHGVITELNIEEVYGDKDKEGWEGPDALTPNEWNIILDDIIFAFQFQIDFDSIDGTVSQKEYKNGIKRQKRGLKFFSIYFNSLWD